MTTAGLTKSSPLSKQATASGRPKLLFLACYFRPVQASACVRTWNIAKYLARSGWDVTVVTPDPSLWRDIEDHERVSKELDQEGITRILTGHRWCALSPEHLKCSNRGIGWAIGGICRRIARRFGIDKGVGWINEAERACASLTTDKVDVILASGPPFASFILARRLSDRLRRPYVLDYRDPWHGFYVRNNPAVPPAIQRLEEELAAGSAAVIAISESLLDGQPALKRKMKVITNGFDPEEMARVHPYDFGHFAIIYAGVFYPPYRVITPVMAALRCLKDSAISRTIPWRFHYYGPQGDHVREEAEKFGVLDRVVLHGYVDRAEALSALRGAGLAVVIISVLEEKAAKDKGVVTGKLFEPLGLRVPVLLVGPLGADVEAIVETTGLVRIVTAKDIDGMVSVLMDVMSGQIPKAKSPEAHSWPEIIKKLDGVLREALVAPPHGHSATDGNNEFVFEGGP